ncbi:MAG: AI-2E family transporter [Chloroflexi bacterium]|nr:AI-2E family transporter [Chloroflexota bacterium]
MNSRKIAMYTATAILVLMGFVFLYLIRNVLFLIFISILLATSIEPLVNRLRRGPFSRGTGILVIYTVIMAILAGVIILTVPPLIDEGSRAVAGLSDQAKTDASIKQGMGDGWLGNLVMSGYHSVRDLLNNPKVVENGLSVGLTVFEILFSAVTVFVIAFYWLSERPVIKRVIFSFIKEEKRPRGRQLWDSVEEKLGSWVRGQIILMLFIFFMDLIGYMVIGLKFAFALAVFAGIAELVPLVGPYIGGAPAILIALTQSPTLAIVIAVYIVIIQLVEGNILVPRIMEKAVGVSPLTVIVGILIGSTLYGILGALLAVPIAAAIQVIFNNVTSFSSDAPTPEAAAAASNTKAAVLEATKTNELKRHEQELQEAEKHDPTIPAAPAL